MSDPRALPRPSDLTVYHYEWSIVSPNGHRRTEPEAYARQLASIPGWHLERRPVARGDWETVASDERGADSAAS